MFDKNYNISANIKGIGNCNSGYSDIVEMSFLIILALGIGVVAGKSTHRSNKSSEDEEKHREKVNLDIIKTPEQFKKSNDVNENIYIMEEMIINAYNKGRKDMLDEINNKKEDE